MAKVMASNEANAWENLAALHFLLKYGGSPMKENATNLEKRALWVMGYKSGVLALSTMAKFPRITSIPTRWRTLIGMAKGTEDRIVDEVGDEWPTS